MQDSWSVGLVGNYVGSYTNTIPNPDEGVDSYITFDLSASYNFSGSSFMEGLSVSAEIRNLFDEDPPYVNGPIIAQVSSGYDPSAASPLGRVMTFSIRKKM